MTFLQRSTAQQSISYLQFQSPRLQNACLNWQTVPQKPFSASRPQCQCINSAVTDTVIFDFFCLQAGGALCHWLALLRLTEKGWKGWATGGQWNWSSPAGINKWCLRGHIGLSNRAPSGQATLHNSWTGYPRVTGRTIRERRWKWMCTPKGFLAGQIALKRVCRELIRIFCWLYSKAGEQNPICRRR